MKTYNGYYEYFTKKCWEDVRKREKTNGDKWWDTNEINDDVNDLPILENRTRVNSSEYLILHHMVVQLMLDYITEHPILNNEIYSCSIEMDLINGDWRTYLNDMEKIELDIPDSDDYIINSYTAIEDKKIITSYDDMFEHIYYFISEFIRRHRDILDKKITKVLFSASDLRESLKECRWMPSLDSSLLFYIDEDLVVCSM